MVLVVQAVRTRAGVVGESASALCWIDAPCACATADEPASPPDAPMGLAPQDTKEPAPNAEGARAIRLRSRAAAG